MEDKLGKCEHEVQAARAKLAHDLATLRDPTTLASFTRDLKQTALDTKDELVDQAKETVRSTATSLVEDLKARAAANPAAALTVGAGLAWHFLRNPPVATVLIGAGLYSLLRTHGSPVPEGRFLQQAKARLGEQASDLGETAASMATDAAAAAADRVGEIAENAKDSVRALADDARATVADASATVRMKAETATESARRLVHDARDGIGNAAQTVRDVTDVARDMTPAPPRDARDKILLGVAGLAVAAALGVSLQKRTAAEVE
jgi:hypothetical protein